MPPQGVIHARTRILLFFCGDQFIQVNIRIRALKVEPDGAKIPHKIAFAAFRIPDKLLVESSSLLPKGSSPTGKVYEMTRFRRFSGKAERALALVEMGEQKRTQSAQAQQGFRIELCRPVPHNAEIIAHLSGEALADAKPSMRKRFELKREEQYRPAIAAHTTYANVRK